MMVSNIYFSFLVWSTQTEWREVQTVPGSLCAAIRIESHPINRGSGRAVDASVGVEETRVRVYNTGDPLLSWKLMCESVLVSSMKGEKKSNWTVQKHHGDSGVTHWVKWRGRVEMAGWVWTEMECFSQVKRENYHNQHRKQTRAKKNTRVHFTLFNRKLYFRKIPGRSG